MRTLAAIEFYAIFAVTVTSTATFAANRDRAAFELTAKTPLVCDTRDRVLRTACEDLRRVVGLVFDGDCLPERALESLPDGAVVIGTGHENQRIREWMKAGTFQIRDMPTSRDAYEIRIVDGSLVVAGSNPGSVLDGVYRLEEILIERANFRFERDRNAKPAENDSAAESPGNRRGVISIPVELQEVGIPFFDWRIFHPRSPGGGGFHDYQPEDFASIRRRGGNTALMMHDWMGEKFLYQFVRSDIFPKAISTKSLERNRASLRRYIESCKDYGLRVALWICEMPCQGGPWTPEKSRQAFLKRYPADVLSDTGTYQGKGLCLAHPLVETYYRELMRGLLTDFPEVSLIQLFTLDSNAEFCSPKTCERHRGVSKIEQRNRLITLMIEEGRKLRPDLRVLTTSWAWQSRPDFLTRQEELPAASGLFSTPDSEAWSFDRKVTDLLFQQRDLCRQRGQMFLGYDIFLWGDDVFFPPYDRVYDFPFGIAAKLRRWARLRCDGVFDQWGTEPELLASNALALRRFLFDPFQPAERVVAEIARRQYGKSAGGHVLVAWRSVEAAQQIQSDHAYYWHALRHNWSISVLSKPPTLQALSEMGGIPSREPHKPAGPIDYAPGGDPERAHKLGIASRQIVDHFDDAIAEIERALCVLPKGHRSFYEYQLSQRKPISSHQQLERQLRTLRIASGMQRELGHFFEAYALAKEIAAVDEAQRGTLRARYQRLLRETLEGTRALKRLLEEIGAGNTPMAKGLAQRAAGIERVLEPGRSDRKPSP